MALHIVSWNVNSLRAALEKGFLEWIQQEKPDIVCLQEVRATRDKLHARETLFPNYKILWNPAEKPGYAGTAIMSRYEPSSSTTGLAEQYDPEGRAITADFGTFFVGSFYAPNAPPGEEKMKRKLSWMHALDMHIEKYAHKPFFLCGDFNIVPTIHDSQNIRHPHNINGCTNEERKALEHIMKKHALLDPMRKAAGDCMLSSWWAVKPELRSMNNGIRCDYILLQEAHAPLVVHERIHHEVGGSDHCPVSITVNIATESLPKATGGGQIALL